MLWKSLQAAGREKMTGGIWRETVGKKRFGAKLQ